MNTLVRAAEVVPVSPGRSAAFTSRLGPALKAHAPLFALIAAHSLIAAFFYAITPGLTPPSAITLVLSFASIVVAILPLSILTICLFHVVARVRPKHPLPALAREFWDFVRQPDRVANAFPVVVVFVFFTYLFTYLKAAIPTISPFSWDAVFMQWDRWVHFGQHPYELLQPLLGYAPVTFVITGLYHLWFMFMWVTVAALAFSRTPSQLRMRFFLAFMLTWIVGGNVLAIAFSSAGPCYYSLIGLSPDPFAPLMSYLHSVHEKLPLWAVDTQLMLWKGYRGEGMDFGISAMPSMHNGAALLFALTGWQINRQLGVALLVFTSFIFIGSIHLGWHYAIDSYAGFAIALVAWWIAGITARWWETTGWAQDYARLGAK